MRSEKAKERDKLAARTRRALARKSIVPPAPQVPGVRMGVISFKGSAAHAKAFKAAGGGAWIRGVLDAGVAGGSIKVKP